MPPNLGSTKYTENEQDGEFSLRYISLDRVENELIDNVQKYGDEQGITREMLELFKLYKNTGQIIKKCIIFECQPRYEYLIYH